MTNEQLIIIRAEDQASKTLQSVGDSIQRLTDRLTTGAAVIAGAVASVAASKAVLGAANSATDAYLEQKEAARGLSEAQVEYTAHLQDLTGVQDEVTNRAMNQAKILGVQEDKLVDVTTVAMGLAQTTGQSLTSAIFKVNEAINGNANAWATYLPAIREVESEEEKLKIIIEASKRGMQDRIEQAGEEIGAINRRKAAMEDLRAAIGRLFAPSIELQNRIAVMAKMSANAINTMVESMSNGFGDGVSFMSQAVDFLFESAVKGVAGVEVAYMRLDSVGELITAGYEFNAIYWTRVSKDFAENAIASFVWLKDNILNVFLDIGNGIITVLSNAGHNMGEFVALMVDHTLKIPGMLLDGMSREEIANEFVRRMSEDLIFNGLFDGFESKVGEMPDMIVSAMSDKEQRLADKMADIGLSIGGDFADAVADKMDDAQRLLDMFRINADELRFDVNGIGDGLLDKQGTKDNQLKAVESRLLTRGPSDGPIGQIAANTKEANQRMKEVHEQLIEIDRNLMNNRGDALQVEMIA